MSTGGIIFAAVFWHTTDDGELHGAAISMMRALSVLVHPDGAFWLTIGVVTTRP